MTLNELMTAVFLLNLPFGHMRSKAAPFSARWMLAIHIPVPFVFLLRKFSGFTWKVIPLLILADIAGQFIGGKIKKLRIR
ncbi:MAG: hypothetical protein AUJ51_13560 [Elusimicrobia bacterium CG1_02_56_21]|nr:MAG: hypothetical protein AUJ51_13560 [Elusimicrobia bacterium CG1_02_56_21]